MDKQRNDIKTTTAKTVVVVGMEIIMIMLATIMLAGTSFLLIMMRWIPCISSIMMVEPVDNK